MDFSMVILMWRKDNGEMIAGGTCETKHKLLKKKSTWVYLFLFVCLFFFPHRLELPLSTKPRSGPLPVVQLETSMWNPSIQILWVFLLLFFFFPFPFSALLYLKLCSTLHSVGKNRTQESTWVFLVPNLMHGVDKWNQQVLTCSYNICFESKGQNPAFW